MKKIFKNCAILLITMFVISCTGRISNLTRNPDEAIVIAKTKFIDINRNIKHPAFLFFDKNLLGTNSVKIDDSAYIYLKLPLGKHTIYKIYGNQASQIFPENFITFYTPESRIYYIGDIYLILQTDNYESTNLGITNLVADIYQNSRPAEIYIEDNYEEAKRYFTKLFPTDEIIYKSIADFDSKNKIGNLDFFKSYNRSFVKPDSLTKSYQRRNRK